MSQLSRLEFTDSICQWLTRDLAGLARVSTNEVLARQFDSLDLVQMAWKSVLTNHQQRLRGWKRDRIRAFIRGVLINKLRQLHRDYLDVEKRNMRRENRLDAHEILDCHQSNSVFVDETEMTRMDDLEFVEIMLTELQGSEAEVLRLKLQGYSLNEISSEMGMHRRSIQKVIHRIRTKFENRWRNN